MRARTLFTLHQIAPTGLCSPPTILVIKRNASRLPTPQDVEQQRRVVVTGLGLVTPLGVGVQATWDKLIAGKSGVKAITEFDVSSLPTKIAAIVPRGTGPNEFDPTKWIPREMGKLAPFIEFAMSTAEQALEDAKWFPNSEFDQDATGVCFGSGMGNTEDLFKASQTLITDGYKKLSPSLIPKVLINLAAGQISIKYKLKGPNHSVATACSSGAHSVGDAYRFIKHGDADVMLCGGTESTINMMTLGGFAKMHATSRKFNDRPEAASRPWDKERDGFVMGEGAGAMVLEEYEHAVKRGATIYAEIRGYGLSGDAHHITSPPEDGGGARRCMAAALKEAGLQPSNIDYINAHATSTPLGDLAENAAIKALFGPHAKNVLISSTKSSIGHLLGAAGAVEAVFAVLALHHGVVPPTINLEHPDEGADLNYVPNTAVKKKLRAVLSNSFGFGGTNSTLVFTHASEL
eukprot:Phypoly_transcript_09111.p1 GENE.Phypoly_transcript_09111~~Phypoly_transcript_09111.p1  ORF type:complete len:462 (+),score=52.69 Phypoly_transcript_09111:37-1422(+)